MSISKRYINALKFVLAALLALSLGNQLGRYDFIIHLVALGCFTLFLLDGYKRENLLLVIVYGFFILLFQPFFTFPLGEFSWKLIYGVVAIYLVSGVFVRFQ